MSDGDHVKVSINKSIENYSTAVTTKGVHTCPGIMGGVEWNGPAHNPLTRMLYTPVVDWCGTFTASPDEAVEFALGAVYLGGSYRPDAKKQGWISAVDAITGEPRWRYQSPQPVVAAVTTSAGGVVFGGELTGHFLVLDAKTGKVLHRFQTGGPMAAE
ncbi:MAG: PQQ-binding-like beta-propeller repeat protein [Bryobacteraceae bacterium]